MKAKAFSTILRFLLIPFCLTPVGCASTPALKMPQHLPPIVQEYKHITISAMESNLVYTGISLKKGDFFSVLTDSFYKRYYLRTVIGQQWVHSDPYHRNSPLSGPLSVGCYSNIPIGVDIFVWENEDYAQIAGFLGKIREANPKSDEVIAALDELKKYNKVATAQTETSKEIQETKKQIQALKELPKGSKDIELESNERIAQLEAKLAVLMENLTQLEEMKKQLAHEKEKTSLLTEELEQMEKKEKDLLSKLKYGPKTAPVIVVASPKDKSSTEASTVYLSGVVEDDTGLKRLDIFVNDKPLEQLANRGIRPTEKEYPKRLDFGEQIPLQKGANWIKIHAIDSESLYSEKLITVHRMEKRGNVWAVVIGINSYPNIRQLKYAINDAKMFYEHLVINNRIPANNVSLLLDQEATLTKIRSVLGTHLKKMAGKEDMVLIFFAGHGATEKDVMSPDGDGLEKYLLPYNADPNDLYATALPVGEISRIFERIRSERLVFIADSCYSGASGGRTIGMMGIRSNLSEIFFDRLASGKGRVIMTASGANEVSTEMDELQHGVFTYYLIEGLRGHADADKDGLVTVDEVYRYVSDEVPRATGQEQHPVKKGTIEGRLILSVVQY